jgi:hypothetical protein
MYSLWSCHTRPALRDTAERGARRTASKAQIARYSCYIQPRRLRTHGDDEVVGAGHNSNDHDVHKHESNYCCRCKAYVTSYHPSIPYAPSHHPPPRLPPRRSIQPHFTAQQHNNSTLHNGYNLQTLLHALAKANGMMKSNCERQSRSNGFQKVWHAAVAVSS